MLQQITAYAKHYFVGLFIPNLCVHRITSALSRLLAAIIICWSDRQRLVLVLR